MFKIDKSVLSTEGKMLFNISEQLDQIITLLKPAKVKQETVPEIMLEAENRQAKFKCGCGKKFEKENQLRGHKIKCKAS